MGLSTQQHSGSLNGGSDALKAEPGEASSDPSGENSKTQQSSTTATNKNGDGSNSNVAAEEDADKQKGENGNGTTTPAAGMANGSNGASSTTATTTTATGDNASNNNGGTPAAKAPASQPPPPVLRGTLSFNTELRRHLIRGMWNYENSNAFPPQRFELIRNLDAGEVVTELPKDGEFHGSFSLAYYHTTSKGKQKERSKVVPETGVKIKFTKIEGKEGSFNVDGKGTNQFGIFHINGTATPSSHEDDPTFTIILRKRYEPSAPAATGGTAVAATPGGATSEGKKAKKRKIGSVSGAGGAGATSTDDPSVDAAENDGPLPPPSQSYEKNVVCLRGKLYKEESEDLGVGEIVHRINGMWSSGLDLILADPQNVRGMCNRFEYEHKSSVPSSTFPISGRYTGWFDLSQEDGSRTRIKEKDVTLKFRKNNAGYHNVEGRGSNAFGKYSITGTLTMENVITIFRHFQPRKQKVRAVTSPPPPINPPGQAPTPSLPAAPEPQLKFEEVQVPDCTPGEALEPLKPPEQRTYSAVSRGILRVNEDGSHSCQGKWAVTREHFTNGQASSFKVRLEEHFAAEALKHSDGRQFPLDSAMYKGSFQLKKQGSRYQTVVDQQIVMKFRKNTSGSYNVYGKGINPIGGFDLTGTLIMSGKTGGQVELYRIYLPELLTGGQTPASTKAASTSTATPSEAQAVAKQALQKASKDAEALATAESLGPLPTITPSSTTILPGPPRAGIVRRESTRSVKLPSRLEDDDPKAQLSRIMDRCNQILRFMREKDVEKGAFFSEPVDPVALGIPTYHQVISEPMDLKTIYRKMEASEISTPEEFARLSRLVFENAMTFNVEPTHSVHQAARSLLVLFNQKFRDVERMAQNLRRTQKGTDDDKKKKGKDEKKRKRGQEEVKSLKRRRLDEAQEMANANATAMAAIAAAAPSDATTGNVTRNEFNLMVTMMQQLQRQMVQTYTVLAELSSDDADRASGSVTSDIATSATMPTDVVEAPPAPAAVPEKKKPAKKKAETTKPPEKPTVAEDESKPLTLKEQELLTDTINELPADQLHGVIQIIREAAQLTGDEDEIDLEIDQLDNATQRKLLRYVSKYIKQPKRPKTKAPKKSKTAPPQAKKAEKAASEPVPKKTAKTPPAKPKADPDSFFAIGNKGDSDTDSEGEITSPVTTRAAEPAPAAQSKETEDEKAAASESKDQFKLGDGFGEFNDDNDDEEEDDESGGVAANWNISKPATQSTSKEGDDDDAWGAAREEAEAARAREADKKAREEKMKAEAEMLKNQRMADAAARGQEIIAQRMEEEENQKLLREQQEREAEELRRKAREEARAQVQSVEQTVDLGDDQRDMMRQYEQSFLDKELGSASPSSDFGF